ncbi:unnamed protein product [Pleuronectes platessa]|uniref:Uncharacterized protein n=1 Tax=Pleuronectes platessa TaxID=8262 RepID=A0A9N7V8U5_PLEPL|nr:unnamed protein product [Pleuronectes platessa]
MSENQAQRGSRHHGDSHYRLATSALGPLRDVQICPAPGLQESARSEERSTNTLILFGQAFVWDTSKPKQPGEAPQQGRERGSNVPQDVQTETEKKKMVMMMMAAYL